MNCKHHPKQEAQAICEKCRQPICQECTVDVGDKNVCTKCVQEKLFSDSTPKRKESLIKTLLFFCYSLIPGAAHMSLGLFRRGLQLMILTFGIFSISIYINLDFIIPIVIIPTWFFSFFESHLLKRKLEKGQIISDEDLFDRQLFDYTVLLRNRRLIGICIILLGCFSLLKTLENGYNWIFSSVLGNYYYLLRGSFVPVLLILGGIYLILKAKQAPKDKPLISED